MGMLRTVVAGAFIALSILPARAVDIQQLQSPGGIPFWLVEEPSIPMVALEISFSGGARLDPEGQDGAATMVAGLMEEGAGEMDSLAFARAVQDVSARFSFSASRDEFDVSARMLASELDRSVELLATALADPRFDEEPVTRVRRQLLATLAESETDPSDIAARSWFAQAFPDHAYGRHADGTVETITALDRDALRAAHQRLMTRQTAIVGIVGAIGGDRAGQMIDTLFAGVPEGEPRAPASVDTAPPAGLTVVPLDKPQSVAIFGQAGVTRDDPDFIPAYILNYVLGGGGFVSRLMQEVREERGLAYSVYSYLAPYDEVSLWLGGVQTANEGMAESLEVIRAEWDRIASGDVSEEDLEKAKKYLTGAYALGFDSNAKIAQQLVFLQREGLGADYIDRRNGLVEAVTLDDLKRVAKRLSSDKLSIVVVGQPAGL